MLISGQVGHRVGPFCCQPTTSWIGHINNRKLPMEETVCVLPVQLLCSTQKPPILANARTPEWKKNEKKGRKKPPFSVCLTRRREVSCPSPPPPPTLTRLPSGTPLQPFARIIKVNNNDPASAPLTSALHNNRQMAAAPRPPPRFVWLRFVPGKVASTNMRAQPLQPIIPT